LIKNYALFLGEVKFLRDDSAVKEFEALEEALEKELGPQPDESAVGGVNALLATASQQQVRMPSFV
jgi:hypothetical protein